MIEEWKIINEYENYEVSNFGNVRNKKTKKILKQSIDSCGYLHICLSKNGKNKTFRVHRLVAPAFIDNLENKNEIDHKDRNKQNNNFNNLRWCSRSENQQNKNGYSNTGEKYIRTLRNGSFIVQIKLKYCKCFKSLDDAIKARDEFLNN